MLLLSFIPYLSHMVVGMAALFSYLTTGQAAFLVTGDYWGTSYVN